MESRTIWRWNAVRGDRAFRRFQGSDQVPAFFRKLQFGKGTTDAVKLVDWSAAGHLPDAGYPMHAPLDRQHAARCRMVHGRRAAVSDAEFGVLA